MRRKTWVLCTIFALVGTMVAPTPIQATKLAVIDDFKSLDRDTSGDKVVNGGHVKLDNAVVQGRNLQVVKGRDRLNDTAHADTTVSGLFYYENSAGTTKKFIVKETDELVTYDTDGTNRTQILASLADEAVDFVQIGDNVYINSSTDGLHKWTGSGSATAITGVSVPSSVDFSSTSTAGGLISGNDCELSCKGSVALGVVTQVDCSSGPVRDCGSGFTCLGDNGDGICVGTVPEACVLIVEETSSTYSYRITSYNNTEGLESEASLVDTASLVGSDFIEIVVPTGTAGVCSVVLLSGNETATTGTLASAPADPFNVFRVYRTVASGSEYFLVGEQDTGVFTDGKTDIALSIPLDTTINTIEPPSFRYITEYKGILFTAEGTTIRFQRASVDITTDMDKYWLEPDQIPTGARKRITGLHNTANSLLIFTENRIMELTGFGLTSFRLRTLMEGIGGVTDETIETDTNGDVIFFAGVQGVYKLNVGRQATDDLTGTAIARDASIQRISSPILDVMFAGNDDQIDLDPADYSTSHAYYDLDNDFYWLFINEDAFIYDNLNKVWSHIPGIKASVSAYRRSANSAGQGVLLDDVGFFWNNWTGYENGAESGTVTGNPTSSASTTLTDTGATFNTTLDGLAGVWVIADCSDTLQYRRISSNTATVLTVDTAWDSNPTTSCDYYVSYIIFDILTKDYSLAQAPKESITQAFTVVHNQAPATQDVASSLFINKSSTRTGSKLTLDFADASKPFVSKYGHKGRGNWMQYGLRSFVYNISDTVDTPIDIISYAIRGIAYEED